MTVMERDNDWECELYDEMGDDFAEAWNIMREAMQAPPSLDVFLEGLGSSTPHDYAQWLVSKRK